MDDIKCFVTGSQGFIFDYERNREYHDRMIDDLGGKSYLEGKNILDIGCGHTLLGNHIEDRGINIKRYVGIEHYSDIIEFARSHFPDVEIIQATFPFLKEEQRSFLVSCNFDVTFMSMLIRNIDIAEVYLMIASAIGLTSGKVSFDLSGVGDQKSKDQKLRDLKYKFCSMDFNNIGKYVVSIHSTTIKPSPRSPIYTVILGSNREEK